MTSETYQAGAISHEVIAAVAKKADPMPVIITEQRRKLNELTLFELGLLPFLYLELLAQKVYARLSPKAS